jgi:hypothetical protein
VVVRVVRVRLHLIDVGFVDVRVTIENDATPNVGSLLTLRGRFQRGGFVFLTDMEGNLFAVNADKVILMVPLEVVVE